MSDLLTGKRSLWLKQLNLKLNEKGFELKKRRGYIIEPMGEGRTAKVGTIGQPGS
jgi:hypothetical protein